jgi:hypothetical protein
LLIVTGWTQITTEEAASREQVLATTRGLLYTLARLMGDVSAVRNGRVGKRLVNRLIGRSVVSRLWWR